jgi:hypothetical protein
MGLPEIGEVMVMKATGWEYEVIGIHTKEEGHIVTRSVHLQPLEGEAKDIFVREDYLDSFRNKKVIPDPVTKSVIRRRVLITNGRDEGQIYKSWKNIGQGSISVDTGFGKVYNPLQFIYVDELETKTIQYFAISQGGDECV